MNDKHKRKKVLKYLLDVDAPVDNIGDELSNFSWDYEGTPTLVTIEMLKNILQKYLKHTLTAQELEQWANLVECREDLEYEDDNFEIIEKIINYLANPTLYGEINPTACTEFYNLLESR